MRKKGDTSYRSDAEDLIYEAVTYEPKTTRAIANETKARYFSKIHPATVKRMLHNLQVSGKVRCYQTGKTTVWVR